MIIWVLVIIRESVIRSNVRIVEQFYLKKTNIPISNLLKVIKNMNSQPKYSRKIQVNFPING